MDKVGVGVVGVGRIGRTHAENVARKVTTTHLVAVVDSIPELAKKVAGELGNVDWYSDIGQMLRREDVDGVVISTPTFAHMKMIIQCAEEGKHIFCEKPLTLTLDEADRAIAAIKRAGVKFLMGYMRRFDRQYSLAKQKVDSGAIGRPVVFKVVARDPSAAPGWEGDPKKSGGIFPDMASHDFDIARWIIGSEVKKVSAEGDALVFDEVRELGDLDNAIVNLVFENGAFGNIECSRSSKYGYDLRTEILCSDGAVMVGLWEQSGVMFGTKDGMTIGPAPWFTERFGDAFLKETAHFADCIIGEKEPSITYMDGRKALEIALAAQKSVDEQKPVYLPL